MIACTTLLHHEVFLNKNKESGGSNHRNELSPCSTTNFKERLHAFNSSPILITNKQNHVSAWELVLAGFSYESEGQGYIKCEDCGLRLSADFRQHFDPLAIHQQHSQGKCQYLALLEQVIEGKKKGSSSTESTGGGNSREEADVLTLTNLENHASHQQNTTHQQYLKYKYLNIQKALSSVSTVLTQTSTPTKDVVFESVRRQSFANSPMYKDATTRLEVDNIAANGIYLKGSTMTGETLHCAFCNFSLPNDNCRSDYVTSQHLDQSPSCSMLTGIFRQHANVPDIFNAACWGSECDIESADTRHLGIISQFAKYPELAVIDRRVGTFLTYPHKAFSGGVELLANSGYFYSGNSDGSVTCFWCGCESANWRTGENPWQRHARTSASCQFVIQEKGEEYVRSIVEEFGVYREKEREDRITTVTTRMMRPRWDSQPVQKALEIGLERNAVKAVVGRRIKRGEPDFKYVAEIIRDINDLIVPEQVLSAATQSPWLPELIPESAAQHSGSTSSTTKEKADERSECEGRSTNETNASSLQTQTSDTLANVKDTKANQAECEVDIRKTAQNHISQFTCKVCLTNIVGIIFLRCGHLVCCPSCAAALVNCPLCRQEIKATIRVNYDHCSTGVLS